MKTLVEEIAVLREEQSRHMMKRFETSRETTYLMEHLKIQQSQMIKLENKFKNMKEYINTNVGKSGSLLGKEPFADKSDYDPLDRNRGSSAIRRRLNQISSDIIAEPNNSLLKGPDEKRNDYIYRSTEPYGPSATQKRQLLD